MSIDLSIIPAKVVITNNVVPQETFDAGTKSSSDGKKYLESKRLVQLFKINLFVELAPTETVTLIVNDTAELKYLLSLDSDELSVVATEIEETEEEGD